MPKLSDLSSREVAVFVSDLSGFTKSTRKYGIAHTASAILRMRQLVHPILNARNAEQISTEGDNYIVVFGDLSDAVQAAWEMQNVIQKHNETLPPERKHFAIKLNGVGIHFGMGVTVDQDGNLHGTTFEVAYHIGEDICEGGAIVLSPEAGALVRKSDRFEATMVKPEGEFFRFEGNEKLDMEIDIVACTDFRYMDKRLAPFLQIGSGTCSDDIVTKANAEITVKFQSQHTVVMLQIDESEVAELHDASVATVALHACLSILKPVVLKHSGIVVEDKLFVFDEPVSAVRACVEMRREMAAEVARGTELRKCLRATGYGVHNGDMVVVEGTDVHWGDPVNTASKLGQDIACEGSIIVSDTIEAACAAELSPGVCFKPRTEKLSGVEFACFDIDPVEKSQPSKKHCLVRLMCWRRSTNKPKPPSSEPMPSPTNKPEPPSSEPMPSLTNEPEPPFSDDKPEPPSSEPMPSLTNEPEPPFSDDN